MAWALLPHDTPVGDLVGRSVVARGTVEGSSEVVLAARVTRLGDDVAVRWSTLSARTDPLLAAAQRALGQEPAHDPAKESEVHRLPAGATIGAALLAATDVHVERVAVADAERAAKAARLARATASEAERRTALDRVTRILRSLVLYYLPDPDAVDRALTR